MKIAIVNDLAIIARVLAGIVGRTAGDQVAWIASNGAAALQQCHADPPDLILMDLHMPVMDGVESTRRIMAECPCPIVVVTSSMAGSLDLVYRAMSHGALDAIDTPTVTQGAVSPSEQALVRKISVIRKLTSGGGPVPQASAAPPPRTAAATLPLIALGASTGGPAALAEVLRAVGEDLAGAACVIVQHVDVHFAPGLASWLTHESGVRVDLAAAGGRPQAGIALLAATEDHLVLTAGGTLAVVTEPASMPYRPSVDVFFRSLAAHWPAGAGAAALLTGMGKDGAAGLLELRGLGWPTFAQDQATCVVYGMPKAAAELKAARRILPLGEIGAALKSAVRPGRR